MTAGARRRWAAARTLAPAAAALALALAGPAAAAPAGSPWGAGYFPNVPLVDQDGRTVRFYEDLVLDRHVVVSFVYTTCTKQCGPMTANLVRVQRELGERLGKDLHFISISMDPERDTPAALKEYARAYKVGPGWTFLTGAKADVALLRKKLGDLAPIEDHAPTVSVGNDRIGQWMSVGVLDNPKYLANVIGNWLDPAWSSRPAPPSYARAPEVGRQPPGRALYRKLCASCHSPDGDSVGPALDGVLAKRGRPWIERWLKAPEALVRAKDPVALALVDAHGGVVMPNLGLRDAQVKALVGYLGAMPAPAPRPDAGGAPHSPR